MTRGALRWLDLVAIPLLLACALLSLNSSFAGPGYLVVGLIATGLGLATVLLTLRWSVLVLWAIAPVVWLLFGGPVALRALEQGVSPGQMLADTMAGSWTGWGELITTLPYVDLQGAPAMVPFLLGLLTGSVAGGLALRTAGAWGPVLVLMGIQGTALMVSMPGTGQPVWQPVLFATLLTGWFVLRSTAESASARVLHAARGRWPRAILRAGLVLLCGALSLALIPASDNATGASLRGAAGRTPNIGQLSNPLDYFRRFTAQAEVTSQNVHRRPLFSVSGLAAGTRLRFVALDRYDGTSWQPSGRTMSDTVTDAFWRVDSQVRTPARGRSIEGSISVRRWYASSWMPTAGSVTSISYLDTDLDRRDEVRYNQSTSTLVLPSGLRAGHEYGFTAVLPDDELTPTMTPHAQTLTQLRGLTKMDPFLAARTAPDQAPMARVFAAAAALRKNGRYSDGWKTSEQRYRPGHDLDRLTEDFLDQATPVGNDEQYASAMALLANRIGVPARVVVGAVVPAGGVVKGADVHAWVELRIADGSWRTLPTSKFMGTRPPRQQQPDRPPPGTAPIPQPERPQSHDTPEKVKPPDRHKPSKPSAASSTGSGPSLLVLLIVVLVGATPAAKWIRRALRRRRGRPSDRLAASWDELLDRARDLGIRVPVAASRPAQARVLARAGAYSVATDVAVFAPEEPTAEEVDHAWEQSKEEAGALAGSVRTWRRVWAVFNPASLRRRRR